MSQQPFVSYAQNAEDVVLWRALGHIEAGTYVDVGAADPQTDSVTMAFYERGWRGLNIEPVEELVASLRRERPGDVTIAAAAGATRHETVLHAMLGTGLSTLVAEEASRAVADGRDVVERVVQVRTLNDILQEAGYDDARTIHFCKIDVEGFEHEVLAGFDLNRWRPWVLVIESTRPNSSEQTHVAWEHDVLGAGYQFCLFDGLNRFYVATEQADLATALSAPANVLDMPYVRAPEFRQLRDLESMVARLDETLRTTLERVASAEEVAAEASLAANKAKEHASDAQHDSLFWRARALSSEVVARSWERQAAASDRELAATRQTVSWRVTRPLRRVRNLPTRFTPPAASKWRGRAGVRRASPRNSAVERGPVSGAALLPVDDATLAWGPEQEALAGRLLCAASVLGGSTAPSEALDVAGALAALEDALATTEVTRRRAAWLACVATHAAYPTEAELERAERRLQLDGASGLCRALWAEFLGRLTAGAASTKALRIVDRGVVVDVTHTASHDLHTGVQRVVRETVSRWLDGHELVLVAWDYETRSPSALTPSDVERFQAWRDHLHAGGDVETIRAPMVENAVVVPWQSVMVLPEIAGEPQRTDGYRTLAIAGIATRLSAIGYDLIPVTIRETVIGGLAEAFTDYMTVVKHTDRLSSISQACANEFTAFGAMVRSQGLDGPEVVAHLLPSEAPVLDAAALEKARRRLDLDTLPMVLVVGSHEPRKNHVKILLGAERLWRAGHAFHLVFIGGSGWRNEPFTEFANELQVGGRPISVVRRASETTLWAAYQLARFTVFPSFAEGFGLPVLESLISGTPVITSDYGSMAEIAEGGGVLSVDPRDPEAIYRAMSDLLLDDELLERLQKEAAERPWKTWDDYAAETWDHLVES